MEVCPRWSIHMVGQKAASSQAEGTHEHSCILIRILVLPSRIRDKYNLGSHFYIDLWPIADPFLAVFDPDITDCP